MLWYGIGILYDRYGSFEYAEEAFGQVMQFQPDFEKANEIYFRLGIIYKQQSKFAQSLDVGDPSALLPALPELTSDIVLQIHCLLTTFAIVARRHLVSNRTCS